MHPDSGLIVPARKIAVLRANALGDFIFCLPALDALRAAYPDAEITFLGKQWHVDFLAGRPAPVDRVLAIPPYPGVSEPPDRVVDPVAVNRFFEEMRREEFDLAIQIHGGGGNSNPFLLRLGARVTAGLKAADAPALDRSVPYLLYQSEIVRYLETVALVGGEMRSLQPRLAVLPEDVAESRAAVPEDGRSLVVVHPAANDPTRRWPPERFAAVADALAARGARVVIVGTEREHWIIRGVTGAMTGAAEEVCGRLSLRGLAGLLSRAALLVGNDSGPRHLAEAVGTATVAVYWCGNLVTWGPPTRARHRPAISWRLACPRCGSDLTTTRCCHEVSFVDDVPVSDVLDPALELLDAWSSQERAEAPEAARRGAA